MLVGVRVNSYFFYNKTIELVFDPIAHIYSRRLGETSFEPQFGVTTVVKIIDKSAALVPWAAKMVAEKAIRIIPTEDIFGELWVPGMVIEQFMALMLEAKTAPRDILEKAADIGSLAHACLEESIKYAIERTDGTIKELVDIPSDEKAMNCCNAAWDWMRKYNVRWLETERMVYSRKYKYAGTMDGFCIVDPPGRKDVLTIADWKSSNGLYAEYLYQTAAYEYAYEEEFGVDVQDRWILRLGKEDGKFEPWHLTEKDFEDDWQGFLKCLELSQVHKKIQARISSRKKEQKEVHKADKLRVKEQKKTLKNNPFNATMVDDGK